ncbi:MAG: hypothetical protein WDW38_000455 [Sanguina aurantia]
MEALAHLRAGPKVILATHPSCDLGHSRTLLADWATSHNNTIVFVERAQEGTVAHALQSHVEGGAALVLSLRLSSRVPLEGDELEAHLASAAAEAVAATKREDEGMSGGGGGGGHAVEPPSTPSGLIHPLRANSSSLSRLVRDAQGSLVQRLGGMGSPMGQGAAEGSGPVGRRSSMGPEAAAAATAVLLDGFQPPKAASFPIFPDEDGPWLQQWDDYGALINADDYLQLEGNKLDSRSAPAAGGNQVDGMDVDSGAVAGDTTAEEREAEPPTKIVTREAEVAVRAAIRFFDYEGRADGRIMTSYINAIAPRQLVLVHGPDAGTQQLAAVLRKGLAEHKTTVLTPGSSELRRRCGRQAPPRQWCSRQKLVSPAQAAEGADRRPRATHLSRALSPMNAPRVSVAGLGETLDLSLVPSQQTYMSEAVVRGARMQGMSQYAVAWIDARVAAPDVHFVSGPRTGDGWRERRLSFPFFSVRPACVAKVGGGANPRGGHRAGVRVRWIDHKPQHERVDIDHKPQHECVDSGAGGSTSASTSTTSLSTSASTTMRAAAQASTAVRPQHECVDIDHRPQHECVDSGAGLSTSASTAVRAWRPGTGGCDGSAAATAHSRSVTPAAAGQPWQARPSKQAGSTAGLRGVAWPSLLPPSHACISWHPASRPGVPQLLPAHPVPTAAAAAAASALALAGSGGGSQGGIFLARGDQGVTLSAVLKALSTAGISCSFEQGSVVCSGAVVSRGKEDKAHLVLKGNLGKEYYKVRDVLYAQFGIC